MADVPCCPLVNPVICPLPIDAPVASRISFPIPINLLAPTTSDAINPTVEIPIAVAPTVNDKPPSSSRVPEEPLRNELMTLPADCVTELFHQMHDL